MMTKKEIKTRMKQIEREVSSAARSIPFMTGAFLAHYEKLAEEYEKLKEQLEKAK